MQNILSLQNIFAKFIERIKEIVRDQSQCSIIYRNIYNILKTDKDVDLAKPETIIYILMKNEKFLEEIEDKEVIFKMLKELILNSDQFLVNEIPGIETTYESILGSGSKKEESELVSENISLKKIPSSSCIPSVATTTMGRQLRRERCNPPAPREVTEEFVYTDDLATVFDYLERTMSSRVFSSFLKNFHLLTTGVVGMGEFISLSTRIFSNVDKEVVINLRDLIMTRERRRVVYSPFNHKLYIDDRFVHSDNRSYNLQSKSYYDQ